MASTAAREFLTEARAYMQQMRDRAKLRNTFPGLIVAKGALLYGVDGITFGKAGFIDRGAMVNCGIINGKRGFIQAGDNVEIGPYSILWGHGGITIGNNVHIGAHVSITAHEAVQADPKRTDHFAPLDFYTDPVIIEDHVLVCSGTVIVPGVRIGHHSMIGAGAVVTRDIPPYSVAVGVPARPMRYSNAVSSAMAPEEVLAPA